MLFTVWIQQGHDGHPSGCSTARCPGGPSLTRGGHRLVPGAHWLPRVGGGVDPDRRCPADGTGRDGLRRAHRRVPVQAPVSGHPGGPATAAPGTRTRPSRRLVRTVTVVVSCLAVLAAAVVVGVRALGQEPTVTLLANWTGDGEKDFREAVLEPFERKYHIRVDYQAATPRARCSAPTSRPGPRPTWWCSPAPANSPTTRGRNTCFPRRPRGPGDFGTSWAMPLADGHVYWFPLEADLKSIVWYPAGVGEEQRAGRRGSRPSGASAWAPAPPAAGPAPTGSRTSCCSGTARRSTATGRAADCPGGRSR
ncbi:hypothetical protein LT493_31975 [Streptomyces tricolor]|nr:hypothetical protein [Streptomyces tricolor]